MDQKDLSVKLNDDVKNLTKEISTFILRRPELLPLVSNVRRIYKKAKKKRIHTARSGLHVPPYMILSVTKKCNLNCRGCYDKAHGRTGTDMSALRLDKLLSDAAKLGTGVIITAGGEPFMRDDLIHLMSKQKDLLFVVFTNGLLLGKPEFRNKLKSMNILPVISIEGSRHHTDSRRGPGTYEKAESVMKMLKNAKKQFGISVTVTKENLDDVLTAEFQTKAREMGASILFYIDYVPFEPGTERIELDEQNRIRMLDWIKKNKQNDMLTVAFPGNEKPYGGCLAAGRGFIHIAADGSVEPCPFAPVSMENVMDTGLEQALRSPFLRAVRENTDLLEDESHGCALFHKKKELLEIRDNLLYSSRT